MVLIPREIPIFLNQRFCEMSLSMFQLTAFSFCELYVINRYVSFVTRSSGSSKLYLKQNYIAKCFGTKFNLNRSRGPCNWFVCKISDLWKEIYQDITPFFAQKIWHLDLWISQFVKFTTQNTTSKYGEINGAISKNLKCNQKWRTEPMGNPSE